MLTSLINAVLSFVGGTLAAVEKLDPNVATLKVVQEVSNDLVGYKVLEANYADNYADVSEFSHNNLPGRIILVRKGGALAQYLGI